MSELNMDAATSPLDLPGVPPNFITMVLQSMPLSDRFTCALVCKGWAEAATAVTRSIILRDRVQHLSCLQAWLKQHGGQVEVLQLHECDGKALTALPCPQLQDLLLRCAGGYPRLVDGSVWSDIAAATKLTSVSLEVVQTASQQADVVSALTALPDLEQLTWGNVTCRKQRGLTDSLLLQKLTKLTALHLYIVKAAEALEHLGLLTRLQDLTLSVTGAAAGCPGLQELKALTRLVLYSEADAVPPNVSQLTALQHLYVRSATPTGLNKLSALTWLFLGSLEGLSPGSPPLQLPGLQHLQVMEGTMPMSYLGSCTQLRVLKLSSINLSGPGSLVASSMLQDMKLSNCRVSAADGAADPVSWQQVFPGPGRLPHLTSLEMWHLKPALQHADMECVVAACCSTPQVLQLDTLQDSVTSALTRLPGLTSLMLGTFSDQQCSSIAQLTGLRGLRVLAYMHCKHVHKHHHVTHEARDNKHRNFLCMTPVMCVLLACGSLLPWSS